MEDSGYVVCWAYHGGVLLTGKGIGGGVARQGTGRVVDLGCGVGLTGKECWTKNSLITNICR